MNELKDPRYRESVLKDLIAGKINRKEASIKLEISIRQVSNLKKQYLERGTKAFTHGNTGRINAKRTSKELEDYVVKVYKEAYAPYGFNFSHFSEWLQYVDKDAMAGFYALTSGRTLSTRCIYSILSHYGITSPQS